MTGIALKNGSVVVKDGRLAEGCECCGGGWYCCPQYKCYPIQSIVVQITAEDCFRRASIPSSFFPVSFGLLGSQISGTYTLSGGNYAYGWFSNPEQYPLSLELSAIGSEQCCERNWYMSITYSRAIVFGELGAAQACVEDPSCRRFQIGTRGNVLGGVLAECINPLSINATTHVDLYDATYPGGNPLPSNVSTTGSGSTLATISISIT